MNKEAFILGFIEKRGWFGLSSGTPAESQRPKGFVDDISQWISDKSQQVSDWRHNTLPGLKYKPGTHIPDRDAKNIFTHLSNLDAIQNWKKENWQALAHHAKNYIKNNPAVTAAGALGIGAGTLALSTALRPKQNLETTITTPDAQTPTATPTPQIAKQQTITPNITS